MLFFGVYYQYMQIIIAITINGTNMYTWESCLLSLECIPTSLIQLCGALDVWILRVINKDLHLQILWAKRRTLDYLKSIIFSGGVWLKEPKESQKLNSISPITNLPFVKTLFRSWYSPNLERHSVCCPANDIYINWDMWIIAFNKSRNVNIKFLRLICIYWNCLCLKCLTGKRIHLIRKD